MTKSDSSSKTTMSGDPERSRVLFALRATRSEAPSGCLEEEVLAALVEQRLPEGEAERAYAHLSVCPHCYERWLALEAVSESADESKVIRFSGRKARRWTLGLAMAASLLLAVIVWRLIPQGPLELPFEHLAERTISTQLRFPLPWDGDSGFAFGGDRAISQERRTLALGIWTARREYLSAYRDLGLPEALVGVDVATLDEVVEYRLGRWLVGLFLVCETGGVEAAGFWNEQQQAVEKLKSRVGTQTRALLDRIAPDLERLAHTPGNPRGCRKLNRSIERSIAQRF